MVIEGGGPGSSEAEWFRVRAERKKFVGERCGADGGLALPPIAGGNELARPLLARQTAPMTERFERHRQPWTPAEIQKLHHLASKGASLAAICKALTRSEESVQIRAKLDKLLITKKR